MSMSMLVSLVSVLMSVWLFCAYTLSRDVPASPFCVRYVVLRSGGWVGDTTGD